LAGWLVNRVLWVKRSLTLLITWCTFVFIVAVSEFLAKESNEQFWSFVEAVSQFDLQSPQC